MSQQGADDWWQKLYETPDPDPAVTPDPADTLDTRFHSASSLTHRVPPQGQTPSGPQGVPPEPAPGSGPPGAPPEPPGPPPHGVLPRPRREAGPEPAPLPRDPREPGTTGYGLGSVTVPPALPEEQPGPPVRRRDAPPGPPAAQAPPERAPYEDTGTPPGPEASGISAPDPAAGAPGAAAPDPGPGPGSGPWPRPGHGASTARDRLPDPRADADADAEPLAPWEVPGAGHRPEAAPPAGSGTPVAGEPWDGGGGGGERPAVGFLGDRAPTYAAEPGALPLADPGALEELVPDTVLEGARHGAYTLRATSVRGDSARFRGEARRDFLLTARFGTGDDALVLVALAGGDRAAPGAAEAAAELCRWIASAVGRSRERLADDIRAGRRDALRSGLQRLTDRGYGRLRAHAAELGLPEEAYTAGLRVLLLPIDPECKTRVCFGSGAGGLFRLRGGTWEDLEPQWAEPAETGGDGFRFRAAVARPRDTLLLCSGGLADPMREEGLLPAELAARWADREPPGLAVFLADTQLRLKGYADDRTAAAVWEA
ncbi:protein phosphatase 2C domain-containing protein [Streptomyces sp. NBC_01343]|uniref:protein phosphatase 2C domain-containing protein n=1 Tax=Streptomyces sp. NBC_01343 TaxID=2903832 RepID=UPI002E0EC722|nr:protein phosphatase 2C domain-containing protein [Streptomyces sp. NBC_01343]